MHWRRALSFLISTGLALVFLGCSKRIDRLLLPNENPVVRLGMPRVVASSENERTYAISWDATDADGQVRHVLVALDPPSLDPNAPHWIRTNANTHVVTVTDAKKDAVHRFVVRAVDDRGGVSEVAILPLGAGNLPPTVRITCPIPSALTNFLSPPAFTILWEGIDPDGIFTTRPVKYKYLLLSPSSEFPLDVALQNPDSLENHYVNHPNGPWAGWDSTSGDTTNLSFSNFVPFQNYAFALVAFDEAGAHSTPFSLNSSILRFRVLGAGALGPRFTILGETMEYTYLNGGYLLDPSRRVRLEVPGGAQVPIRWYAETQPGSCELRYRWVLDPEDLFDYTPRSDEETDVKHWSALSSITTSATLGPFTPPSPPKRQVHTLYFEADDGFSKSLAILELIVVPAQSHKELLIVDDTRYKGDNLFGGTIQLPTGPWPTAAELDTFLFARGYVEWRTYPEGTQSRPGVFAGYSFDTLGTRRFGSGFVPLSTLAQYRHVVWIVDGPASLFRSQFMHPETPTTALRLMGLPGHSNALASYVRMGGKLWLAGGGAGAAVSDGFNDINNDYPTRVFSSTSPRNELGPGRFMYDVAKWQSQFRTAKPVAFISKSIGRFTGGPTYTGLPDRLDAKSPASDPLISEAPTRSIGSFYQNSVDLEYLDQPNVFVEDVDPSPELVDQQSTLDTLYRLRASTLPDPEPDPALSPRYVVMTHYRGASPAVSVLHSGFPFWWAQRTQCEDLIDFVLGDLWGLTKGDTPVVGTAASRKR